MKKPCILWHFSSALALAHSAFSLASAPDLSNGVAAFEQRQWSDAMDAFLEVLRQDPTNTEAHAYVALIAREMEAQRQTIVRDHRLEMLGDASKRVEANRQDPALLTQAILDTTQAEKRAQEQKWHDRCEEARMQRNAGHLLAANDLILQVLAENDSFPEAQRELSELQSQIRHTLDSGSELSIAERYALQGFYAYGQADYAAALTAWNKTRTVVEQSYPGAEGAERLNDLHFGAYEKIAPEHTRMKTSGWPNSRHFLMRASPFSSKSISLARSMSSANSRSVIPNTPSWGIIWCREKPPRKMSAPAVWAKKSARRLKKRSAERSGGNGKRTTAGGRGSILKTSCGWILRILRPGPI